MEKGHLEAGEDLRPAYAVGHIVMKVPNIKESGDFFLKIGLREVHIEENFLILEVRGGTHIILEPTEEPIAPGTMASFDLMVDDIPAIHKMLTELGTEPTAIEDNTIHSYFTVEEPGGHTVLINSSHATGLPV